MATSPYILMPVQDVVIHSKRSRYFEVLQSAAKRFKNFKKHQMPFKALQRYTFVFEVEAKNPTPSWNQLKQNGSKSFVFSFFVKTFIDKIEIFSQVCYYMYYV